MENHISVLDSKASMPFRCCFFFAIAWSTALAADVKTPCLDFNIARGEGDAKSHEHHCRNLTSDIVAGALEGPGVGTKKGFFANLRQGASTSLTGEALDVSGTRVDPNGAKVIFIGDSIVRELAQRYAFMILGDNGLSAFDELHIYSAFHIFWEEAGSGEEARKVEEFIKAKGADVVFVNGLGVHFLHRHVNSATGGVGPGPMNMVASEDPMALHRVLIRSHLAWYKELSARLGVRIVFVGTPPLDETTFTLAPPKLLWTDFYDFSLARLWDLVENEVWSSGDFGPLVSYFRTSQLTAPCPGIRCDGMHFGSDYIDFGCRSSIALWDGILASFLSARLTGCVLAP